MPNLTDKDIADDILDNLKASTQGYTMGVLEAADQNIRQTFVEFQQGCQNSHWKLFNMMNERGWYQVPRIND